MFKMDQEFKDWLNRNRYGNYNGMEIRPDTEMVAYTYVFSIIVMTFRRSTRYYFKEAEKGKAMTAKILCILCNLICGWWGIPWGPIWTIKETFINLINHNKICWSDFVGESVEKNQQDATATWEQKQMDKKKDTIKQTPKKKIAVKDLIIYILIGLAIAVALIVADMGGML